VPETVAVIAFVRRNINEIAGDRALLWSGAALAALNATSALFWLSIEPLERIIAVGEPPVCWPFLPTCYQWRVFDKSWLLAGIWGLLALSLFNVVAFVRGRVHLAWVGLLVITAAKSALVLQDYRLIHNQHYMAAWAIAVFLFVPCKRSALPMLIVSFYFWAGVLKLNPDWISGVSLYGRRPLNLPEVLIPAACMYVIVLELVIVFGILSRRSWLFWFSFSQLLLFQISSFWVVGWFYPIVMFLILLILILVRLLDAPETMERTNRWRSVALVAGLFAGAQQLPALYAGESAVTGEGRFMALHMFDAPLQCRASRVFPDNPGMRSVGLRPRFVYPRISCEPLVYFELAQDYCRARQADRDPDFTLLLETRHVGGQYQSVIDIKSFCESRTAYRWWKHNDWIRSDTAGRISSR
jgi:hypothetical protein